MNALRSDRRSRKGSFRPSQLPALGARGLILVYRYTLSSLVGRTCRHLPTCSEYADIAVARFGLWRGGWMAFARFWRCRPFGTHGFDPVPDCLPDDARWYTPWRYGRWGSIASGPAAAGNSREMQRKGGGAEPPAGRP